MTIPDLAPACSTKRRVLFGIGIALTYIRKVTIMFRLRNLLLPVDYSTRSLAAADAVRLLGSDASVKVTVLHATDETAQRRANEELISEFSNRLAGFDVAFREVAGDPAERIIEYSRSSPTDLIVMPTRRRGPLPRFLQGSITDKVLRGVECPVWTGVEAERASPKQAGITRVACGVDLGPKTADVLRWAGDFAQSQGARLTVIHASSQLVPTVGVVHDPEWRGHVSRIMRAELVELAANAGVKAEIVLAPGEPVAAVAEAAERWGADVLVIGRTPKGFSRWLRSAGYGIIRHAPCAVISVDRVAYRQDAPARLAVGMDRPAERYDDEVATTSTGAFR